MKVPSCECYKKLDWDFESEGYHILESTCDIEYHIQHKDDRHDRQCPTLYSDKFEMNYCPICGKPYIESEILNENLH